MVSAAPSPACVNKLRNLTRSKLPNALLLASLALAPMMVHAQELALPEAPPTSIVVPAQPEATAELVSSELPEAPRPQVMVAAMGPSSSPDTYSSSNTPLLLSSLTRPAAMSGDGDLLSGAAAESAASFFGGSAAIQPVPGGRVPLSQCPYDKTHARECRVHWRDLAIDGSAYLAFQNIGNIYTGFWYRWETTHGKWWDRYVNSVEGWRWRRWSDGNPFLDDYVGHSMMGAITNYIWIENDPKGMTLLQSNTREYWKSRLRAFVYSTAFSFQWKLGPLGEAGIGHNGDHYFYEEQDSTKLTNETGDVELVTTPVGGLLWNLAEDRLDQSLVAKLENKSRNPLLLISYQFLTPARATANIFRFRAPWYRDTRQVHATGLFHKEVYPEFEPTGPVAAVEPTPGAPVVGRFPDPDSGYAGNYEFGTYIGFSGKHDEMLGSNVDTRYMDIIARGSGTLHTSSGYALRYSPEVIAVAMLDEPTGNTNPNDIEGNRKRTYGTGVSPEGLQLVCRPTERVQPYLDEHAGIIYFFKPVLTPTGDHWVYNANFGGGINFVRANGNTISVGYRLQHLGPAQGMQRYGTDAHTVYFAISRFFKHRAQVY